MPVVVRVLDEQGETLADALRDARASSLRVIVEGRDDVLLHHGDRLQVNDTRLGRPIMRCRWDATQHILMMQFSEDIHELGR